MTDLVKRLRPNVDAAPWVIETVQKLEDETASLRQRVQQLEGCIGLERIKHHHELAALKAGQGEPVAWLDPVWLSGNYCSPLSPVVTYPQSGFIPLYTSAPTIPKGWKLVPVKPTKAQLIAGAETAEAERKSLRGKTSEIYKAFLAAAPKPEELK